MILYNYGIIIGAIESAPILGAYDGCAVFPEYPVQKTDYPPQNLALTIVAQQKPE